MGEMAEYYRKPGDSDRFAAECQQQHLEQCYERGIWVTKDGREIRVREMSDQHVINTLRLLQRKAEFNRMAKMASYLLSSGPQGEHAQDAFDQEQRDLEEKTWRQFALQPIFDTLETEAMLRKLEWNLIKDAKEWAAANDLFILSKRQDWPKEA